MDLPALRTILVDEDFRADAYDLGDAARPSETYVLRQHGAEWIVFYAERGQKNSAVMHPSLDEAAQDLLDRLRTDSATRRVRP